MKRFFASLLSITVSVGLFGSLMLFGACGKNGGDDVSDTANVTVDDTANGGIPDGATSDVDASSGDKSGDDKSGDGTSEDLSSGGETANNDEDEEEDEIPDYIDISVATEGLEFKKASEGTSYYVSGIGTAKNETTIVIPQAYMGLPVSLIWESAFENCTNIVNVYIPDRMSTICTNAFSGCTSLENIYGAKGVNIIHNNAFSGCTSLKSFSIPSACTMLGNSVFQDCTSLTDVTISANVSQIGKACFRGCTNLTSVKFKSYSDWSLMPADANTYIEKTKLTDPQVAAQYLVSTYSSYYWSWKIDL